MSAPFIIDHANSKIHRFKISQFLFSQNQHGREKRKNLHHVRRLLLGYLEVNEQSGIMSSDIVHLHHVRPVDQLLELSHRQTIQLPELLLRHLGGLRGLLVGREGVREGERR